MTIQILKFWEIYKPKQDGSLKPIDMVAYCPVGSRNTAVQVAPVSRLSKVLPLEGNEDNLAVLFANDRWNQIEPAYRQWKAGNEIPIDGTPLGGWPGINQETAQVLKDTGIRTVEEFAEISDGVISKIRLPNMKELRAQAKMYLESRDNVAFANQMNEKDEQIKNMRAEMEELKALVKAATKPAAKPRKKAEA